MSLSTMNVTKLFASWANEEKEFRAAAARADAERQSIATQLQHLRSTGARLSAETCQASNALGTHQGQIHALKETKATLQQQLKEERIQLEVCARETAAMANDVKRQKRDFSMEMEALNEELMHLLQEQEDQGLECLITMESVAQVFGGTRAMDTNNKNAAPPALHDAIAQLERATIAYEVVQQELDAFRAYRAKFRAQILATHRPPLTAADLDDLERMWEQHDDTEVAASSSGAQPTTASVHNELFYSQQAETTPVEMDAPSKKNEEE